MSESFSSALNFSFQFPRTEMNNNLMIFRTSKRHLSKAYFLENIRNLYKLCISWDIIFHFLLFLFKFGNSIFRKYLFRLRKKPENFLLQIRFVKLLERMFFVFAQSKFPAEKYLSIRASHRRTVVGNRMCVLCCA